MVQENHSKKTLKLQVMDNRMIFIAILCQFASNAYGKHGDVQSHLGEWAYDYYTGPEYWFYVHPLCNGTRQSPVNILENEVVYNDSLTPLVLLNYSMVLNNASYYLLNNGHTVMMGIQTNSSLPIGLLWKGRKYNYYGLHFHWGENDTIGCEHTLSNQSHPLEVHIIHYLSEYGNFTNALNYGDGLLVWGNIFQIDNTIDESKSPLQELFSKIDRVTLADNKTFINPIPLNSFVADNSTDSYYHYEGSLTAPECTESVMWIVNQKKMKVTSNQMKNFRLLKGHLHNATDFVELESLKNTFRPTQPLFGRKVYTSVQLMNGSSYNSTNFFNKTREIDNSTSFSTGSAINTTFGLLLLCFLFLLFF
ncbi:carbonic anhydrase 2-like [Hydra vulgaris]|uniref:carbonic anhydrase n=1 Tax=Hydra vulgaris TaxID=6087 RepID=A0ABM4DKC9_HYDVU